MYILQTVIVIIHNSWYLAHGVKRPRITKSCKASGILNIALSERWSTTKTDSAEGKIYNKVSKQEDTKEPLNPAALLTFNEACCVELRARVLKTNPSLL